VILIKSRLQSFSSFPRLCGLGLLLCMLAPQLLHAQEAQTDAAEIRQGYAQKLEAAAHLYGDRKYAEAALIYLEVSSSPNLDQASWALELYGVCLEQQGDRQGAVAMYQQWLTQYAGSAGEVRVQQRQLALQTAASQPKVARRSARKSSRSGSEMYGSSSLMYRSLVTDISGQGSETNISSLSGDVDLHLRGYGENWSWRSRLNGGYLSDQSGRGKSNSRISNLYVGITHESSGAELTVGRQRSSDNGIYGYLDGATFSYPLNNNISFNLIGGATSRSSRSSSDSNRLAYGVGTDFRLPDSNVKLQLYAMEQTYDGLTERRAIGSEVSYFNDYSHYLVVMDYDVKFGEANNLMFNGSWNVSDETNIAVSLGYQRSPFLSASNATIGEYELDLKQLVNNLGSNVDIYDLALEKTALSRYGSLVINHRLSEDHRIVGEIYHYEMSDLPSYDDFFDSPDSDANTTYGLQYIWSNALMEHDALSMSMRYTTGDVMSSASIYLDEKFHINQDINTVIRLRASQRWQDGLDRDVYSVGPGVQLNWFFTRDFMLEMELGYEWSEQQFGFDDLQIQQGFMIVGVRKRF
jgi:hypothetical protein